MGVSGWCRTGGSGGGTPTGPMCGWKLFVKQNRYKLQTLIGLIQEKKLHDSTTKRLRMASAARGGSELAEEEVGSQKGTAKRGYSRKNAEG